MILNDTLQTLEEIKEKYHQYCIEWFDVKEYNEFVEECDIQEDSYLIDFNKRIIYLR